MQARTYDYTGEAECDRNMEISLDAIKAAQTSKGFAAVKVSSELCDTTGCVM
jgi:hypothetical protein